MTIVLLTTEAIAVIVCIVSVVIARRARREVRRIRRGADWSGAKDAAKGFDE